MFTISLFQHYRKYSSLYIYLEPHKFYYLLSTWMEGGMDKLKYLLSTITLNISGKGGGADKHTWSSLSHCHFLQLYVLLQHLLSSYIFLCNLMSLYVILCLFMSSYVILCLLCHLMSFYVFLCHLISFHVILYQVMSSLLQPLKYLTS